MGLVLQDGGVRLREAASGGDLVVPVHQRLARLDLRPLLFVEGYFQGIGDTLGPSLAISGRSWVRLNLQLVRGWVWFLT